MKSFEDHGCDCGGGFGDGERERIKKKISAGKIYYIYYYYYRGPSPGDVAQMEVGNGPSASDVAWEMDKIKSRDLTIPPRIALILPDRNSLPRGAILLLTLKEERVGD